MTKTNSEVICIHGNAPTHTYLLVEVVDVRQKKPPVNVETGGREVQLYVGVVRVTVLGHLHPGTGIVPDRCRPRACSEQEEKSGTCAKLSMSSVLIFVSLICE